MISGRAVNASPLIFLTRVNLLEVLHEPGVPAVVPDAVFSELGGLRHDDPAALAVGRASWLQVVPSPAIPAPIRTWALDAGESAVLAVALETPNSQVILDDLAARRCAKALNIPLQGTSGLFLVAKRLGLISEIRPVLDTLRQSGMDLSDRLARQVLGQAGE